MIRGPSTRKRGTLQKVQNWRKELSCKIHYKPKGLLLTHSVLGGWKVSKMWPRMCPSSTECVWEFNLWENSPRKNNRPFFYGINCDIFCSEVFQVIKEFWLYAWRQGFLQILNVWNRRYTCILFKIIQTYLIRHHSNVFLTKGKRWIN